MSLTYCWESTYLRGEWNAFYACLSRPCVDVISHIKVHSFWCWQNTNRNTACQSEGIVMQGNCSDHFMFFANTVEALESRDFMCTSIL